MSLQFPSSSQKAFVFLSPLHALWKADLHIVYPKQSPGIQTEDSRRVETVLRYSYFLIHSEEKRWYIKQSSLKSRFIKCSYRYSIGNNFIFILLILPSCKKIKHNLFLKTCSQWKQPSESRTFERKMNQSIFNQLPRLFCYTFTETVGGQREVPTAASASGSRLVPASCATVLAETSDPGS